MSIALYIPPSSGSANDLWTDSGDYIHPTDLANKVAIGADTGTGTELYVAGSVAFIAGNSGQTFTATSAATFISDGTSTINHNYSLVSGHTISANNGAGGDGQLTIGPTGTARFDLDNGTNELDVIMGATSGITINWVDASGNTHDITISTQYEREITNGIYGSILNQNTDGWSFEADNNTTELKQIVCSFSIGAAFATGPSGGPPTRILGIRAGAAGQIYASGLPAFDDNAAATGGGLVAGDLYRTTGAGAAPLNVAGIVMVVP